jgi:hypothetical protein
MSVFQRVKIPADLACYVFSGLLKGMVLAKPSPTLRPYAIAISATETPHFSRNLKVPVQA